MRYTRPLATLIVCAIALTGCAAAPIPTPPRSPSSAPSDGPHAAPRATPEPQTVDPLAAVTSIVVRPENLDLNDADGTTIQELSYDADAAEFVAALSGVLHATPAVAEKPGGIEWSPSTEYVWPGVTLRDDHERGDYQQDMNLEVEFSLPMVGLGSPSRRSRASSPALTWNGSPVGWTNRSAPRISMWSRPNTDQKSDRVHTIRMRTRTPSLFGTSPVPQ